MIHTTARALDSVCIRLGLPFAAKGRANAAEVVSSRYFVDEDETVYLVTIYGKGDQDTLPTNVLREYVRELLEAR